MDLLQTISEQYFIKDASTSSKTELEDNVETNASRCHLVQLANQYSHVSQALRDLSRNSVDHSVDFCLDLGAPPDERHKKIGEFARAHDFPYYVHISQWQAWVEIETSGVICREAKIVPVANIKWNQSLSAALSELRSSEKDSEGISALVRIANMRGFVMTKYNLREQAKTSLRTFMASTKTKYGEELHGEFSRPDRIRIAFELAECALFFLKTECFIELCSCCIYRLEDADLETSFTVRLSELRSTDHVDPESGEPCQLKKWCEEELWGMHIRRLGVLLIEIAIGSPIYDLAFNEPKNSIEIDFDLGADESGKVRAARLTNILRRVRQTGGQDFMEAVLYCLKQGVTPRNVTQEDLETFHDQVIGP